MKRFFGHTQRVRKPVWHSYGTTLVEVMAAAAMSVLLLGALVLAMQAMRKQETLILQSDQGFEPWKQQLRNLIEWDAVNSRTWNHQFSSLRMVGFTGRNSSEQAQFTRQQIEYRFLQVSGETWLIRESTPLDRPNARPERTLLCRGVRKILIGRPEDDLRSLLAPRSEFDTLFPIPTRIRCVLVDSHDQPLHDFLILKTGGDA